MEPLLSLKRERPTELTQCIFCQEDASEKLLAAKEQGLSTLNKCVCQRQKLRDPQNRAATDRIVSVFTSEQTHLLIWHKSCYSSYTSKERISRLKKSEQGLSDHEKSSHPSTSAAELLTTPASRLRSSSSPMNWEACIFCQNVVANTKLSSVTTMKTSQRILEAAKFDQCRHVRMAGVSDLIASEGKYHPNCYKKFLRITSSTKEKSQQTDLAMQWLIDELKLAADKSHVLEMSEVWNRYCVLSEKAGVEVPQSFISRRASFKEKLEPHMSDIYEFIFMSNRPIDDRITLLMPVKFGHIPIGKLADENTFLALPANKADLARFLSEQLTAQAPDTKTIVVAGGFRNEEKVESSNPEVDTDKLAARQEEADTTLMLHCVEN